MPVNPTARRTGPPARKLGFRELRKFIDDSLHGPQEPNDRGRHCSKSQFLDLLELLSGKVGADEFDGYMVFTFPRTNKALLERPVYGNAGYVLGPDWKRLSRMSKRELLADGTLGVTKIVHRGDWFARMKAALSFR